MNEDVISELRSVEKDISSVLERKRDFKSYDGKLYKNAYIEGLNKAIEIVEKRINLLLEKLENVTKK